MSDQVKSHFPRGLLTGLGAFVGEMLQGRRKPPPTLLWLYKKLTTIQAQLLKARSTLHPPCRQWYPNIGANEVSISVGFPLLSDSLRCASYNVVVHQGVVIQKTCVRQVLSLYLTTPSVHSVLMELYSPAAITGGPFQSGYIALEV